MEPRIDYRTVAPGAMQAMGRLEVYARRGGESAATLSADCLTRDVALCRYRPLARA